MVIEEKEGRKMKLSNCPKCKKGQLIFLVKGFVCDRYPKCNYEVRI